MEKPVLYLPLLHEKLCLFRKKPIFGAKALGVGLEEEIPNAWIPTNYPFTPKEVTACLMDMRAMGEAALSGVPLQALASMQTPSSQLQMVQEQEALDAFVQQEQPEQAGQGGASIASPNIHVLRTAHKFLLWAWLMEEHIYEIQNLSKNYSDNIHTLVEALGVEHDEAMASLENIQTALGDMNFPLPPWELVLENVAPFLPQECCVVINCQEMQEAIKERIPLAPLSEENAKHLSLNTENTKECVVTIGSLIQKNEKGLQAAPWLEKKLLCIILEAGQ